MRRTAWPTLLPLPLGRGRISRPAFGTPAWEDWLFANKCPCRPQHPPPYRRTRSTSSCAISSSPPRPWTVATLPSRMACASSTGPMPSWEAASATLSATAGPATIRVRRGRGVRPARVPTRRRDQLLSSISHAWSRTCQAIRRTAYRTGHEPPETPVRSCAAKASRCSGHDVPGGTRTPTDRQ